MRLSFCAFSFCLVATVQAQPLGSGGRLAWLDSGQPAIRGVTIGPIESSLFPGRGYGTASSAALLDVLARQGVNWVSITPFGQIWDLQSTEVRMEFEAPYEDNRAAIARMVEQAHERGMKVLLIPHLWVETGGWRGEMEPPDPDAWEAYRRSYRRFVMAWARDSAEAGVDAFSIGVECKSWSGRFGGFWRGFISDIRDVFPGLLTYSANWDEAEDVLFWDQLDLIGINAFYPLADHDDASFDEYLEGAQRAATSVAELTQVLDMPVIFSEVGYTTRANSAVEPWVWPDGLQGVVIDEREQARALLASFRAILPRDDFAGFFIWRYYADLDDVSQEAVWGFSPHGKRAERLLRRVYRQSFGGEISSYGWLDRPMPTPPTWSRVLEETECLYRSSVLPR